ncbi:MAG: LemA family protein [Ignavibacteriaceae bacterium]|nr:LemA family protein [Ignavibacteriaceae bacterium]
MKNKGLLIGCAVGGIILIAFGFFVIKGVETYNNIADLNQAVSNQWVQVEDQYQKRTDLVPSLTEAVKDFSNFEQDVLTQITKAHLAVSNINTNNQLHDDPHTLQKFQSAQGELTAAIKNLVFTIENYPELKANENVLQLQAQLVRTENQLLVEKKKYNHYAEDFNIAIKKFPVSLLAGMLGFKEKFYLNSL